MKHLRLVWAVAWSMLVMMAYADCSPVNATYLASGLDNCTVDNSTIWTWNSYNYAKATAFKTGLEPSEAHLFTPELNLMDSKAVTFSFTHVHRYCDSPSEELTLWVTPDFQGSYEASTWYQLTINPYADQSDWKPWLYVSVNVPAAYVGSKTVFAFKYQWTSSSTGTWELKNVNIQSECANGETVSPVSLPDIGDGRLRIFAQNLQNYYYNLNTGRGNYTEEEFREKTRKIVDAMMWSDADIYALCEVEAQPIVLAQLADSMNRRVEGEPFVPVYDGIAEPWSSDKDYNIKSGFIYNKNTVKEVGSSYGGTAGYGYYSHTMRIQTFEEIATGERFTLSMNHFKAKDSSSDKGNGTRVTNATNLVNRLPQFALDPDLLILGDLNCEVGEEPLTIIQNAGYEEQLLKYNTDPFSHCYNGGELIDHVFANATMSGQITGAGVYHLCTYCSPESSQNYNYRYSDHDPCLVGLKLGKGSGEGWQQTELEQRAQKTIENGQLLITLPDGSCYNGFGIRIR